MGYFYRSSWDSQLFIGLISDARVGQKTGPIIGLMRGAFIDTVGAFDFYMFNFGQFV